MALKTIVRTLGVAVLALGLAAGAHWFKNWRNRMPPPVDPISNVQPGIAPIVFMGDSVFYLWTDLCTHFTSCANVGIGGQTSADMLARFDTDVTAKHPRVVVLFAGINDLIKRHSTTVDDVAVMAAKAAASGARVILSDIVPADWEYPVDGSEEVRQWNAGITALARAHSYGLVNFYDPMLSKGKQNRALFWSDLVHPNGPGYAVMWPALAPLVSESP